MQVCVCGFRPAHYRLQPQSGHFHMPQAPEILQYFGNEKWAYIQDMSLLDYEREECGSMPLLPQASILPSSCRPDWRCAR